MENLTTAQTPTGQIEQPKQEQDSESLLEQSIKAAARIERANAQTAALLDRQERLMAAQVLGGRSEAGYIPPIPQEETAKDYAKRVMRGDFNGRDRRV